MDGKVFGTTPFEAKPLDATLTVYVNSDFIKEDSTVVSQGRYSEAFTNFGWYIIDFSAPGFADARDTIWVMNSNRQVIHKDYYLVPLDSKLTTALNDIHFNFDESTLHPDCYVELDYLGQFLKHNPDKQVVITGYTDNRGPKEHNLSLSNARAHSVVEYLKAKGVSSDQLVLKANGDSNPIDTNTTMTGAAKNRRVELLVINKPVFENAASMEPQRIHFAFGETSLNDGCYQELNRLVELTRKNPSAHLEIAGHADGTGPADYNEMLSNARAEVVADYLRTHGVDANHLTVKSYGAKNPIDSNSTPDGKARNRRVEISLLNH
jgi:outer membrane protein OmpA-like peptidoglycan-associated protein